MTYDVAALYIDPRGPYPKMPGVDCYDEERNAEMYAGPWPVVAHPPCGAWGNLRQMPGLVDRGAHFGPTAVQVVQEFGGVLEQPAGSKMFEAMGLPKPCSEADKFGGFTVEVEQVNWGHPARKRTWLYCVGVSRPDVIAGIKFGAEPTHWVSGGRKRSRRGSGGVVPPGIKVCSAQQRRRTPQAFADWLVTLARSVRR